MVGVSSQPYIYDIIFDYEFIRLALYSVGKTHIRVGFANLLFLLLLFLLLPPLLRNAKSSARLPM
jgi:hypothetical protein